MTRHACYVTHGVPGEDLAKLRRHAPHLHVYAVYSRLAYNTQTFHPKVPWVEKSMCSQLAYKTMFFHPKVPWAEKSEDLTSLWWNASNV